MQQAKSRSTDSCQNGTSADHYHKTNNVGSGTGPIISPAIRTHNKLEWNVLLTLSCHIRSPFIRIFAKMSIDGRYFMYGDIYCANFTYITWIRCLIVDCLLFPLF